MQAILFPILVVIGLIAVIWYVVATLLIYEALRKRGFPVNFLFLRLFAIQYANQYKEATRDETGKVGPLFYHWVISINLALVVLILLVLVGKE